MKKQLNYFQKMMLSITFAEAGGFDTAREMMPEKRDPAALTMWDRIFSAISFAEAGLFNTASEFLTESEPKHSVRKSHGINLNDLGLKKIHLYYGSIPVEN